MRISISILLLSVIMTLSAQNTVTFQVNMNEYSGTYTDVNLNGTFNGWCGGCALMTDDDQDGIYTIDVDLANGQIEYKFTTDGWTEQENFTPGGSCTLTSGDFTNRVATIEGSTTLDVVCWEACEDCGAPPSSVDVTFSVDMSEYVGSYTTVNLNGAFNGWCGACAEMTDQNSDGIYEITANVPTGLIEYKFTVDGWEDQEMLTEGLPCTMTTDGFTNRVYMVEEESTLPPVCWNSCDSCVPQSIEEFTSLDLSISPNPTSGLVQISIAEELINEGGRVDILNLEGKLLSTIAISSIKDARLDLGDLGQGMYVVRVQSTHYQSVARVFIQK